MVERTKLQLMKRAGAVLCGTCLLASVASAAALPKYNFLRWKEDWSVLKQASAAQRDADYNRFKYHAINPSRDVWVSFGGHARYRIEDWDNVQFNTANDDTYSIWRLVTHADLHIGRGFRAFVEAKFANSSNRDLPGGQRTLDIDAAALQQAFFDVVFPFDANDSLTVRVGRQEYLLGKQRLVSPLPWANTLRTWDGITAMVKADTWNIIGFTSNAVTVKKYSTNRPNKHFEIGGVYASTPTPWWGSNLDLYWLALNNRAGAIDRNTGRDERNTYGARVWGKLMNANLDYDVEYSYQKGSLGTKNVRADMVGAQVGYRFSDVKWAPRFFIGYDYASGGDPTNRHIKTFNQLQPLGHAFLGFADVVGRQNIRAYSTGVSFKPFKKMVVGLSYFDLNRDSRDDAVYAVNGTVLRAGNLGTSKDIGQETDLFVKYGFSRHVKTMLGWSHVNSGNFIEQSGTSKDINFVYGQIVYMI